MINKIPLFAAVKKFLKEEGFKVQNLWQPERHLVGIIYKDNKKFFFKMAVDFSTNINIENEYKSTKFLQNKLKNDKTFSLRNIIKKDNFIFEEKKLCYFISDYINDEDLINSKLESNSKEVAKLAFKLNKIKLFIMPFKKKIEPGEDLFRSASKFAFKLEIDTEKALKIITNARKTTKISYGHGDFSPWHIYKVENQLVLIDSEHAGAKPKYYDLANYYLRLRQNFRNKKQANLFIKEFIRLLPFEEKKIFWKEFRPVLAERTIGHLWEIKTGHSLGKGMSKVSANLLLKQVSTANFF